MQLIEKSATELGEAIKKGEVTVAEAVESTLEQIEKAEGSIRAYLTVQEREALLKRAEEVQRGIADGTYTGPLAGVPVAVKDNICTAGMKTTCASKILSNFIPPYDAKVITLLKEAGAVIVGKTNMDEFAMGSTTETSAFQVTGNPWDLTRVPGGSSGGSCAAVAAGEAFLALGSDTGGSIRQPSAYCGVTGMKPTYGTVSRYGLIAYGSSLDQIGPVGKSVSDCAAALSILSAADELDSTSMARQDRNFMEALTEDVRGMKIGVPEEYLSEGLQGEVAQALKKTAEQLKEMGAEVETFSLKLTDYVIPAYYLIACAEASSNLERFDGVKYGYRSQDYEGLHDMYKKSRSEGFGREVKRRIMLGSFVLSSGYYDAYYIKALKAKRLIKEEFDRAFKKYDILLAPAAPTTAPLLGKSLSDPLKMYLSDIYTVAVNLAGLSGLSLPVGFDGAGLPIGIQFLGDCFQEKKVIRAAYAAEKARGSYPMAIERLRENKSAEKSMSCGAKQCVEEGGR